MFHPAYIDYCNILLTTPLSFVFYFVVGCYIAEIYPQLQNFINKPYILLSLLPLFFLLFIPQGLDSKSILTGVLGAFFTFLSCGIVLVYSLYIPQRTIIRIISKFLGDISYGVYLLHPLVWRAFNTLKILDSFPIIRCAVILVITSAIAFITKKTYEDLLISFFKKKTNASI